MSEPVTGTIPTAGPALLVHAADPHLDFKTKQVQRLNELGRNIREYDFYQAFECLVEDVLAMPERPVFVIAGDLFDTPRPTNAVQRGVVALLNRLEAAGIEVLIIAGNHDTPQMHTTTSAFETLMEIEYEHIHFAYAEISRVVLGDVEYILLPHTPLSSGLDPEDVKPDRDAARYSVLVTHGIAGGMEQWRQPDEQREMPVSEHLLSMGHDYVALGHYHRRSRVAPGVWYAGSLENTVFGKDSSPHHGALLVDIAKMVSDPGGYEPPMMEVPVRPMVEPAPVDLTGIEASEVKPTVERALEPYDLAGALVRITLSGLTKDVYDNVDRAGIIALGREALVFKPNWDLRQVHTELGVAAEGIRSLDLEFADAVEAYYGAHAASGLPDKDEVRERGLAYVRTFLEAEAEADV